jgi:hypothetical protein
VQVCVIITKLSCSARQIFSPLEIVSVTLAPRRTSTVDSTATSTGEPVGTTYIEACNDINERGYMKIKTPLLTVVIGAGLAFGVWAQTKQPGEMVSLNSLPTAVQETIKDKAAGGEIVQVKREDDANGKWNYEVVVRTNGKESAFEVDPHGKFVTQHTEIKR